LANEKSDLSVAIMDVIENVEKMLKDK
jgi:hypothetical protein